MNKLYILLILIITVVGITELFFIDTDTKKTKRLEASLINTAALKNSAKAELTNEEKEAVFKDYAEKVYNNISGSKPRLTVFTQALQVYHTLNQEAPVKKSNLLTVIDFSLPSTEKRLWVFDLENNITLENTVVSHGKNSGMNKATKFSNKVNSYKSSLGAYLTAETYVGKHGLSLRLDGLEKGINDRARERAIVIHTASYANPSVIEAQGRLGRSLGCPAIPVNKIDIIKNISEGSVLFIYANDKKYTSKSRFNDFDSAYNAIEKHLNV
jgi:hypothetical protein